MSMTWFVYALRSQKDAGLYIGMTGDVKRRLAEHNRGYNRSTKSRRPFELMFVEELPSRQEARQREKFFKTGQGRELLRRGSPA